MTSWNVTAGFSYQFNKTTKLDLVYTTSKSSSSGTARNFTNVVQLIDDSTSLNGVRCFNSQLTNNDLTSVQRTALQAAFDRQCIALTSTDPNLAFNPFKSASGGPGASVADFFYLQDNENRSSRAQSFEARISGSLFSLPGGPIQYAAGGEVLKDGLSSLEVAKFTAEPVDRNRYAGFAEVTVPILGNDFNLPLVKQLTVNVAGRFDSYRSEGAVGTVGGIPASQGGEIIYASSRFSRVTPAYGVRWQVSDGLVLRARWTNGFRAPEYSQLFNQIGTFTNQFYPISGDPLYDCVALGTCSFRGGGYFAQIFSAPNQDLKPQTSTQQSYSADWRPGGFLRGLSLSAVYNYTEIKNQFARQNQLTQFMTTADSLKLTQFYERDATGRIIRVNDIVFNLTSSKYSSLNLEGSYIVGTKFGSFEPKITYVKNIKSETQGFPNLAPVSTLGRLNGVDRYRIVGSVGWYYHDLTAQLWAYHTPGYVNDYDIFTFNGIETNPDLAKPVRAYTTIDLTASWRVTNALRLNFAGRNIFDADPPFVVVGNRPYDVGRYNPAGRTLSLEAQFTF